MSRPRRQQTPDLESGRNENALGTIPPAVDILRDTHEGGSTTFNTDIELGRPLFGFRLTGFRLITILSTCGFGLMKAILSSLGQSAAPNILDWMFGVALTLTLGGIWWVKEDADVVGKNTSKMHKLLFEKDYGRQILAVIDMRVA
ncbi:hypothetical protein M422DRAFT_241324 [Sphaerobolus stellatus SS14]|nr:hypothetical protein M422DRAFT_241324 [Sphaerobolus stellatus SS14]